jgi:hypothetical protein
VLLDGLHALAEVNRELELQHHAVPELEQLLLADLGELDLADERQLDRRGHRHLLPRVVEDRAAQRVLLLDDAVAQALVDRAQARREAGRPRADDDHVELAVVTRRLGLAARGDRLHRLAALLGGLADQAHAAELAGDEQARHVGLEIGLQQRDVQAAFLGAEDQRDRIERAGRMAGAVADAGRGVDQRGLAVDHAQRMLGADLDAGAGADAQGGVDDRVQRRRLVQARRQRVGQ